MKAKEKRCHFCLKEEGAHKDGCPETPRGSLSEWHEGWAQSLESRDEEAPAYKHPSFKLGWSKAVSARKPSPPTREERRTLQSMLQKTTGLRVEFGGTDIYVPKGEMTVPPRGTRIALHLQVLALFQDSPFWEKGERDWVLKAAPFRTAGKLHFILVPLKPKDLFPGVICFCKQEPTTSRVRYRVMHTTKTGHALFIAPE